MCLYAEYNNVGKTIDTCTVSPTQMKTRDMQYTCHDAVAKFIYNMYIIYNPFSKITY